MPQLSDNNIYKIKFQKVRILVFLFYFALSKIMSESIEISVLDKWVKEGNSFLIEISKIVLGYRESLKKSDNKNLKINDVSDKEYKLKRDYYQYFNIDEEMVEKLIFSIYGI